MIKQVRGQRILIISVEDAGQEPSQTEGLRPSNEDTVQFIIEGMETSEDEVLRGSEGTWRLANGTGRLTDISGGGTYIGTARPGGITYQITGKYGVNLPDESDE
jgi:hypothetical protein